MSAQVGLRVFRETRCLRAPLLPMRGRPSRGLTALEVRGSGVEAPRKWGRSLKGRAPASIRHHLYAPRPAAFRTTSPRNGCPDVRPPHPGCTARWPGGIRSRRSTTPGRCGAEESLVCVSTPVGFARVTRLLGGTVQRGRLVPAYPPAPARGDAGSLHEVARRIELSLVDRVSPIAAPRSSSLR
jgi:hypothetical protein